MPAIEYSILSDIVSSLRAAGAFEQVSIGPAPQSNAAPRAILEMVSRKTFRPDDVAVPRWARIEVDIAIHTRAASHAEAADRLTDLARQATIAVMADTSRGGLCQDLPIGQATEVGDRSAPSGSLPSVCIRQIIRCHYQYQPETTP